MPTRSQKLKLLIAGMGLVLLQACDPSIVFDKTLPLPEKNWNWRQEALFEVEITDTNALYELDLTARINDEYPYSNLYVIVSQVSPDGDSSFFRQEVRFFEDDGRALGLERGTIWEYRIPIRPAMGFSKPGIYRFGVTQNMRVNTLKGVLDVGLALRKSGEKF